jgi:DNA polymerase III epsilon subunit-like protein
MRHFDPNVREIVLDTETAGLDPLDGHRVVEQTCINFFDTSANCRAIVGSTR